MMNHLHITLVGGQSAPVYEGIVYENPDYTIFICSSDTVEIVQRIGAIIDSPSEHKVISPVNVSEVESYISSELVPIARQYNKVSVNVTSGTKIWSILFFDIFKKLDSSEVIYIDQNNVICDLKKMQNIDYQFTIPDTKRYLEIIGQNVIKCKKLEEFNQDDLRVAEQIEEIRKFDISEFNNLTKYLNSHPNVQEYTTNKGSLIKYDTLEKSFSIKVAKRNGTSREWKIKSPNAKYLLLNTGWFELKVAQILSKWQYSKEIILNCEFINKGGATKNEVDIIMNTGTKLMFVECKTQVYNSTDMDKFATVIRNYGGLSTSRILITYEKIKESVLEKCNESGILTFSLNENNHIADPTTMLYLKLEYEWLKINPK